MKNMASKWKIKQCKVNHHIFICSLAIPFWNVTVLFCCVCVSVFQLFFHMLLVAFIVPCTIWFMCVLGRNIRKCLQSIRTFAIRSHKDCYDLIISSWIPEQLYSAFRHISHTSWTDWKFCHEFSHRSRFKIKSTNSVFCSPNAGSKR